MVLNEPNLPNDVEVLEGMDLGNESWGEYPLDELLIRNDHRTVHDVLRRIAAGRYVMNPDFQRDFIWHEDKQSKLIESVIMRIPLPVFYMAEDRQGRMVVVDGLQRLTTFKNFVDNQLSLRLPDRPELDGKRFEQLAPKFQNRVEDCNLIFYIIDSKAPERARLDIFERVNGGVPLTRQQMRNCLFMGPATIFLREEAKTSTFLRATGSSLNKRTMRDREFINRFCAFATITLDGYKGDMDDFLAQCLSRMNAMDESEIQALSDSLRRSLRNNYELFGRHAFRKSCAYVPSASRSVINASLWDVMSTGLATYSEEDITASADELRDAMAEMLEDEDFVASITYGTSDTRRVGLRFEMSGDMLREVLGA